MSFIFHVLNRVQGSCQWKTWRENNILGTRSVFSSVVGITVLVPALYWLNDAYEHSKRPGDNDF